ncbi:hypothetical protein N9C85_01645 [Synechococcus sp. AH-224-I15]|nr:hypothetical protein [Synechococcus sp. AH-224-I15]
MGSKTSGSPNGNGGQRRSEALIDRDIEIYKRHMRGESIRAIGEIFDLKSSGTVSKAIARGKEHAKLKGIDVEEKRIVISEMFEQTLQTVAKQVQHQALNGLTTTIVDPDGGTMTKTVAGIDPRLAAELGRSLHRWSEFLGLMDRTPDQNVTAATTVVLAAPPAGAAFDAHYDQKRIEPSANEQVVDAAASTVEVSAGTEGARGWGAEPYLNEADSE